MTVAERNEGVHKYVNMHGGFGEVTGGCEQHERAGNSASLAPCPLDDLSLQVTSSTLTLKVKAIVSELTSGGI